GPARPSPVRPAGRSRGPRRDRRADGPGVRRRGARLQRLHHAAGRRRRPGRPRGAPGGERRGRPDRRQRGAGPRRRLRRDHDVGRRGGFPDARRGPRRPGQGHRRAARHHLPGPRPRRRQAPDGALDRSAHDHRAPALPPAGVHPAARAGLVPGARGGPARLLLRARL
ncbi:MAG: Acetyltransferase, partial [uncultured Blastococcus sp.]